PGKGGVYGPRSGFCLETQNFPDAVNNQSFPSPVVRKGEVYRTKTVYEVSLIS
ncbi:MAG: galactose-1-epimerase, partial [Bacillota bacterium]